MKKIMQDKRNIFLLGITIVCMVLVLGGVTFAFISYNTRQRDVNVLKTNCLKVEMEELTNALELQGTYPLTDEAGKNTTPYRFKIRNVCNVGVAYHVNLEVLESENRLPSSNVATMVDKEAKKLLTSEIATMPIEQSEYQAIEAYTLYAGTLGVGEEKEHSVRLWLDESAGNETQNKEFQSKIVIDAVQNEIASVYKEGILNGADPVLKDGLIPVTIDSEGVVRKADEMNEWYSYGKKNWANAVILQNSYDLLNEAGKVHGATKEDGYVHFDGVDDYIDLGLENYDFGSSITRAISFKLNEYADNGTREIIGNAHSRTGGSCWIYKHDQLGCNFFLESNVIVINYSKPIELGKYYTLVFSYDGNKISFYLDGNLIDERNIAEPIKISSSPFFIGSVSETQNFANIDVKEAAIFDRALTQEEIERGFMNEFEITNSEKLLRYVDFTDKEYKEEEIIPEDAIESYFVWIPKYSYQLWDLGNYDSLTNIDTSKEHSIPIKFGTENTEDSKTGECTTPMNEEKTQGLSGESGNCKIGDYMTHPAFISMNTNGLWVGKFETGYKGATSTANAQVNEELPNKLQIKPNIYSWREIQVANAFYTSYNYKRELDSHMMKNTEWGAVAYLSNSVYGLSAKIRSNNNELLITGYAAKKEPTCGYTNSNEECNKYESVEKGLDGEYSINYFNSKSVVASTTGNYSGIYDMSGGAVENLMGVTYQNEQPMSGLDESHNSGFSGINTNGTQIIGKDFPAIKYFDRYITEYEKFVYKIRILGDASGEMGPFEIKRYYQNNGITYEERRICSWYMNEVGTVRVGIPWVDRGGFFSRGENNGVFYSGNTFGDSRKEASFRVVLAI